MNGGLPEPELGNEWTAHSVMMGPVKMVAFYDTHNHGPQCLFARAAAWFAKNGDWGLVDVAFDMSARIVAGEIQAGLVCYVQDVANPITPLQVLEEPFFHDHLDDADKRRQQQQGFAGFMLDPSVMIGTREEVIQKLRDQGVPDFVIEMLLGGEE